MPRRATSTDHIRAENTVSGDYRMFCRHCGRSTLIVPPMTLDMAVLMMRQFVKEHRHCPLSTATEEK